jgi:hypothetical protein
MRIASTGIAMKTSHAPCVNLVIVTISSTDTVIAAPTALITRPLQADRRSRRVAVLSSWVASSRRARRQ